MRLAPPLAEVVTHVAEPFIQAIYDIEVSRMAFGRICLIGDAAFAVRPHAAAGTAKAAADGWALA
jgi:2,6-dihydroxypyridine 3-monooxygenase